MTSSGNLSDDVRRRRDAALAGHRGDEASARDLIADPDPGVRATALGALARAGRVTEADLRAAMADDSPVVRRRAAEVAAASPGVAASLLPLLGDAEATVVEVAAWAAGERPPEAGVVEALAELVTGHEDALVREAAVAALGAIGDPAGLAAVIAGFDDKATVRRRAVLALAAFDGPEVEATLQRATTDRDPQVRQAAEDLLEAPSGEI